MAATAAPRPLQAVLDVAAAAALRAPSVLNTQPWRWIVHERSLDLRADPGRQLGAVDPEGRMLTISCGAALDHALIALRTEGYDARVELLPDARDPELLAAIYPAGHHTPLAEDFRRYQTTLRRHTDRRPFGPDPVTEDMIAGLTGAALAHGVHVHVVRDDQVPTLSALASVAAGEELADPAERAELARWTRRAPHATEGLATDVTVQGSPRRVPLRPHAEDAAGRLPAGPGNDSGARYLILWGNQDGRRAWLRAGQALSAVLLTAAESGLAASPMTDLVEVTDTRVSLRRLLSWQGHPYAVLRVGVAAADLGVPAAHRLGHDEVVEIDRPSS
ncbi:Acg family FMN-binding oxidoreductase [Cryptosporangium arvum]|uniref:Nitroreductase family oxidoreductase n=1 Tax=Cryptosporangium arvum DSM 44712 TaxID=927661 RepID=A0A011AKI9_9ACTN|nr:nitroreductase family protein [Cryptosporangium arvum]EXG82491.1 nitroreductase family oxidoreductase [Cryptosporangium arvum DSM 44712]